MIFLLKKKGRDIPPGLAPDALRTTGSSVKDNIPSQHKKSIDKLHKMPNRGKFFVFHSFPFFAQYRHFADVGKMARDQLLKLALAVTLLRLS